MLIRELENEFEQELEQALAYEFQVVKMRPEEIRTCPPVARPIRRAVRGFATGKSKLTTAQKTEVRRLAKMVLDSFRPGCKPITRVRVIGHTDDTGSDAVNNNVGRKRAIAVRNEMKGFVDAIRAASMAPPLTSLFDPPESRGESLPEVPNTSAAFRAQNRRVVVILE